ncbi:MAG: 4Fe-4S dicluster domain-containing protein [Actinomycetota bacterium]
MGNQKKIVDRSKRSGPYADLGLVPAGKQSAEEQDVSRRNMLLGLGAVGVATMGGALGLVGFNNEARAAGTVPTGAAEHQWCRIIDLRACVGERKCVAACQTRHGLPPEQTWMRILSWQDEVGKEFFMPVPCQMCENPPCLNVCPVSATFRTPEGLVLTDQDTCIGSRACMAACPYEARYFNWNKPAETNRMPAPSPSTPEFPANQIGTVGKCVLCADRIPYANELPSCVEACPRAAQYIGDFVTDVAVNGRVTVKLSTFLRENNAVRFKEELGTNPRTYYILGNGQPLGGPMEGVK